MAGVVAAGHFADELRDFYRRNCPSKAAGIDDIMRKYAGQEDQLRMFLEARARAPARLRRPANPRTAQTRYGVRGFFRGLRTDFRSSCFDATAALVAPESEIVLPVPNVRPMDTLSKCRVLVRAT